MLSPEAVSRAILTLFPRIHRHIAGSKGDTRLWHTQRFCKAWQCRSRGDPVSGSFHILHAVVANLSVFGR